MRSRMRLYGETIEEKSVNVDVMARDVETIKSEVAGNKEQPVNGNSTTATLGDSSSFSQPRIADRVTSDSDEIDASLTRNDQHGVKSADVTTGKDVTLFRNVATSIPINVVASMIEDTGLLITGAFLSSFNISTAFGIFTSSSEANNATSLDNINTGSGINSGPKMASSKLTTGDLLDNMSASEYSNLILASGKALVDVPKVTTITDESIPNMEKPIVNSIFINSKPTSYAGAVDASSSEPRKGKANFRLLEANNLCDGVDFTIPIKVVEAKSTHFEITLLYGYFIGKRVAFSV
ncbi:hypothetical protein Tco_0389425 [Tanacetum coccineum]